MRQNVTRVSAVKYIDICHLKVSFRLEYVCLYMLLHLTVILHTQLVQGAAINTCPPSAVRRRAAGRELQGPLRVLRTVCAVSFSHMVSPLFTQRSNQLEHVRVVETT